MAEQSDSGSAIEKTLQAFQRYFCFELACDSSRRAELYRLRYDVYCREFGFEREEDCPGGMESDVYDESAWHCLIRHVESGKAAGSVRIIEKKCQTGGELPLEAVCGDSLYPEWQGRIAQVEGAKKNCELSRLAVHTHFRRRLGEKTPYGDIDAFPFHPDHVRSFPLLSAALFSAASYIASDFLNKDVAYVMMEPRLQRNLRRTGLQTDQIGELIDYHGQRAPYRIDRSQAMAAMESSPILGYLYQLAREQLHDQSG